MIVNVADSGTSQSSNWRQLLQKGKHLGTKPRLNEGFDMYTHVNQVVRNDSLSVLSVQVSYKDIWSTERFFPLGLCGY